MPHHSFFLETYPIYSLVHYTLGVSYLIVFLVDYACVINLRWKYM